MSRLGHRGCKRACHGMCSKGLGEIRRARVRELWLAVLEDVLLASFADLPSALAALARALLLAIALVVHLPALAAASPPASDFRVVLQVSSASLLG